MDSIQRLTHVIKKILSCIHSFGSRRIYKMVKHRNIKLIEIYELFSKKKYVPEWHIWATDT